MTKRCIVCGRRFEALHEALKFCGTFCRRDHRRRYMARRYREQHRRIDKRGRDERL